MSLVTCPSCGCHVYADTPRCPNCAATARSVVGGPSRSAAILALVVGAAMTGSCQELYGAAITDVEESTPTGETASTGDTGT